MESVVTNPYSRLLKVTDTQWLKLIEMLTEGVMAVNGRTIVKSELSYSEGGHYPKMYFRLTSELQDPEQNGLQPKVTGFVFGFDRDVDDEVYIEPLGPDNYEEVWLKENGITDLFTWHEAGIRKLYRFLSEELELWSGESREGSFAPEPFGWRTIAAAQ